MQLDSTFIGTVSTWVVAAWMTAHSIAWIVVEGYRLWRSTLIKLRMIHNQKEAGE